MVNLLSAIMHLGYSQRTSENCFKSRRNSPTNDNTSDANIFHSSCAIQLYAVITRENSPSFRVMIGPRSASGRFCDRSRTRSNVGIWLEPRIGQTSALGHEYAFSAPLTRVWNVAVNRRSGPAVGYPAVFGRRNARC